MAKAKGSTGNQYTGKLDWSHDTTSPKTLKEIGIKRPISKGVVSCWGVWKEIRVVATLAPVIVSDHCKHPKP